MDRVAGLVKRALRTIQVENCITQQLDLAIKLPPEYIRWGVNIQLVIELVEYPHLKLIAKSGMSDCER